MTDWTILDNDMNDGNSDDDVEFVGVVEDEDEESVPQVQVPRRPVTRVARQPHYPMQMRAQTSTPVQMSNNAGGNDGMAYFPTESGARLAMNQEALQNMRSGGIHDVGGRSAMRVSPGTYVTYGPSQSVSGQPQMSPAQAQGMDAGMGDWISDLIGGVAELGTGIATSVQQTQAAREQARVERERLRMEAEAAAEARSYAHEQSQMEHEQALETLRQRRAELEELQQAEQAATAAAQQRAAAEAAAQSTAVQPTTGTSPVLWIVLAFVLLGGLGGTVYFLTRKKDKEE